jgi:hypothetical protein
MGRIHWVCEPCVKAQVEVEADDRFYDVGRGGGQGKGDYRRQNREMAMERKEFIGGQVLPHRLYLFRMHCDTI